MKTVMWVVVVVVVGNILMYITNGGNDRWNGRD
jgi:hypothetical protein